MGYNSAAAEQAWMIFGLYRAARLLVIGKGTNELQRIIIRHHSPAS